MNLKRKYKIIIPGKSVGKESVRVERGHGRIPDKSTNFMAAVKLFAMAEKVQVMECCQVDIFICLPVRYKAATKRSQAIELEPKLRPDEDNVRKAVKDGLQGIAYRNDKQVVWGRAGYFFIDPDLEPCTVILITEKDWRNFRIRGSLEDFLKETEEYWRKG